ncbi:MAG: ABC transporter permease [Ardenticatenaceae bacterium]|nr:ABC transporter permease [Ardenticatenaceae bacterium]HBY97066.1 peptide ABC transporter permease [Chloroflexota bacterium]
MSTATQPRTLRSSDGAIGTQQRLFIKRSAVVRIVQGNLLAVLGAIVVLVTVLLAILAPAVSPYDPLEMNLQAPLQPPSLEHPLGTDSYGRDLLSRIIHGSRVTLLAGTVALSIALVAGLSVGLVAGYAGGMVDLLLMRAMDGLLSFPPILLAIALLSVFGPSTVNAMLALGIVYTPQLARLVRSTTLTTQAELYVTAARAVGVPDWKIMLRHVLPNAIPPVIVQTSAMFAYAIVAVATLSFLGLGTQPPTPDWGEMVSTGRSYLQEAYWVALFPALAIMLFVTAVNLLGDGIRDMMDPRYRKSLI